MPEQDSNEVWKPVENYPGYEVSNMGRIRNPRGLMTPSFDDAGYPYVKLVIKSSRRRLHRLVAEAFLGPIPSDKEVNHRNGAKSDARLDNLEIVTHRENMLHSLNILKNACPLSMESGKRTCQKGEGNNSSKLTRSQVKQIMELRGNAKKSDVARRFGVSPTTIYGIWTGRLWKHSIVGHT